MKTNWFLIVIPFMVISLLPNGRANAQSNGAALNEARKAIAESNRIYFEAFVKGDSSIFIDRYAEDCCIMPPGSPAICGPGTALEFFRIAYYDIGLRN